MTGHVRPKISAGEGIARQNVGYISSLQQVPGAQLNVIGQNRWSLLQKLKEVFQWVPGPRGIQGNEAADKAVGDFQEKLDQSKVPIDLGTSKSYLKRHVVDMWRKGLKEEKGYFVWKDARRKRQWNTF